MIEEARENGFPLFGSIEMTSPLGSRRYKRRKYLIDRRGQLLVTAKVAGLVLVLLAPLNLVVFLWGAMETQEIIASNPHLAEQMRAIDHRSALLLASASLAVFLIAVVRSIMLTHRTAGAAFNLRRCLNRVASGDYDTALWLRAKDNLRQLQEPFNLMMQSLRNREVEDHQMLEDLVSKIDELGHAELAREVEERAEAKAQFIASSEQGGR
jgi:nitrogen fixation/metabolism regulation signal transduction histidine kinase